MDAGKKLFLSRCSGMLFVERSFAIEPYAIPCTAVESKNWKAVVKFLLIQNFVAINSIY